MAVRPHVLIVGSGIVGASVAWHLAYAGVRVTVVEGGEPGGLATRSSWAWINATSGGTHAYFRLRTCAIDEWRRLERQLPGIRVAWLDGLFWDLPDNELDAFASERESWGARVRHVNRAEVRRLEPRIVEPPQRALHIEGEGAVEPVAAVHALLEAATDCGAVVITRNPVRWLCLRAGRVTGVETATGRVDADEVVIAAGVGAASLVGTAGIRLPMVTPSALLVVTEPRAPVLNGLVMAPAMYLRQTMEGRLVATADLDDPSSESGVVAEAAKLLEAMQSMLDCGATLVCAAHAVGRRPIPVDGFPAIGRVDGMAGLYLAVMHSAITLAPAVGRFVTEEMLTGKRDPLLKAYGLERFSGPEIPV